MTYRSDLTHAACEATIPIDKALLLFARELEAHKALIEKLETQILNLQARESFDASANDYNIESRFDRIETRLDQVESDIENKLDSMDIDERFTEALQNVTFTVTVD
jgi:hypothetical protein